MLEGAETALKILRNVSSCLLELFSCSSLVYLLLLELLIKVYLRHVSLPVLTMSAMELSHCKLPHVY